MAKLLPGRKRSSGTILGLCLHPRMGFLITAGREWGVQHPVWSPLMLCKPLHHLTGMKFPTSLLAFSDISQWVTRWVESALLQPCKCRGWAGGVRPHFFFHVWLEQTCYLKFCLAWKQAFVRLFLFLFVPIGISGLPTLLAPSLGYIGQSRNPGH